MDKNSMLSAFQMLHPLLAETDIYLLDYFLNQSLESNAKILDMGCGYGRNMHLLIALGYQVYGIDTSEDDIHYLQSRYSNQKHNFVVGNVEKTEFHTAQFDFVISNAVLHFASNEEIFEKMIAEIYRILKPKGVAFIRMQMETDNQPNAFTYCLSHRKMVEIMNLYHFEFKKPFKSVKTSNGREMCVWIIEKQA